MMTYEIKWILPSMIMLIYTLNLMKTHMMNSLIILECLLITSIVMMFMITTKMKMENSLVLLFVVVTLSESIMGISILISLIRTHSTDFIKSVIISKL